MTSERPLAYWIGLVERLVDERVSAILDEHGVTRRQWQVLRMLSSGPATGDEINAAIAPLIREEGESAADSVDELVDSGWVAPGEHYELTGTGQDAFARLSDVVETAYTEISASVSAEDQATTAASLEQMARNLGWSSA